MTDEVAKNSLRVTKFWWRSSLISEGAKLRWRNKLLTQHQGTWTRTVINSWLGQPMQTMQDLKLMVNWCQLCMGNFWFVCPRGENSISLGVQIWTTCVEDSFLIQIMSTPIIPLRHWDHDSFEQQLDTMLHWKRKYYRW